MSKYRHDLPQLRDTPFITDGGLETTLIYHEGVELPHFAAFGLFDRPEGEAVLDRYFMRYVDVARRHGVGIVLESATWRANPDWAAKLGYTTDALRRAQRRSIEQLAAIRAEHETAQTPVVISGNFGPRGDGYRADARMTARDAETYHTPQMRTFA